MHNGSLLSLSLVLAACTPEPPEQGLREKSPVPGAHLVILEEGRLTLDGEEVGDLHEPGVLRRGRHGKLRKALYRLTGREYDPGSDSEEEGPGLAEPGEPLEILFSPQTAFGDLYPVLMTAAWAGYGEFHLTPIARRQDGQLPAPTGPVLLDVSEPPLWKGAEISGFGSDLELRLTPVAAELALDFDLVVNEARGSGTDAWKRVRRYPRHLRLTGARPMVDCGEVFEDESLLRICREAQKPPEASFADEGESWPPSVFQQEGALFVGTAGSETGCLSRWPLQPGEDAAWDPPIQGVLGELGQLQRARFSLRISKEVSGVQLMQVLHAFEAAGVDLPRLHPLKPRKAEEPDCEVAVSGVQGVRRAGARWLGELRRP